MEKYEFLSRTGEGAYGSVWMARDKHTGSLVAVKKMKDVPTTDEEGEIAMREVRVLQLAKHVNIVNLLEAYKSQSGRLYLVFEYVERTLLQELRANRGGMPPPAVKSLTWQLLQALSYLHRKSIIHRDVKPSNILITDGGVVKICDFGFARACDNAASDPAYTTYVVTRWYRPPEVLVGDTYGPPVDIWALGCIFAEMLLGRPLFPGKNHHDQLWLILKSLGAMTERQLDLLDADPQFACFRLPKQSEIEPLDQRLGGVGPAAMQVLRACLDPDPKQRASAEELLAMPYFNGVTEVLPVAELSTFPDPDMRSRLDRALAQDHANANAAAVAREAILLGTNSSRRAIGLGAPTTVSKPPPPQLHQQALLAAATAAVAAGGGGVSPVGLQQPQPQQPQQQQGAGPPLPAKAATVAKLEPCGGGGGGAPESQRPPLQRHITAPAGSMAARAAAGAGQQPQQQVLLQPLAEQQYCGQHLLPLPTQQQRSRHGSDSSQQSSPKAQSSGVVGGAWLGPAPPPPPSNLAPARGRSSWRVSGDGSGDGAAPALQPAVRQLCSLGRPQPTQAAAGPGSNAAGPADPVVAALQRPPYQRATWNGSSAPPRSHGGSGSSGGGSGSSSSGGGAGSSGGAAAVNSSAAAVNGGAATVNGGGGPSSQGSFLNSCFTTQYSTTGYDTVTMHRKAHSLAGNEGLLLPPANSAPVGIRNLSNLGGLQGRSLAPAPAQITTGGSTCAPSAGGAFPPPQFGLPAATGTSHRTSVSPPPLGYGTTNLRGTNSLPLGPIPACQTAGRRVSQEGGPAAGCHSFPLPRPQAVATLAAAAGLPTTTGSENGMALNEAEQLEGSPTDAAAVGGNQNEGRRASDTVLYAAVALKARTEKAASSRMMLAPGRPHQHQHCLNDGNGSGGSSGGGAQGLATLRNASSFNRGLGVGPLAAAPSGLAPSSPDCGVSAPANLPPLQGTPPQRRISAPEAVAMAVLAGGGGNCSGGGASVVQQRGGAAGASMHGGGVQTVSGGTAAAASNQIQRHRHVSGQHCHPSAGGHHHNGHLQTAQTGFGYAQAAAALGCAGPTSADGSDVIVATGVAHVLLPSLDVGGYAVRAARASSAGNGNGAGAGSGGGVCAGAGGMYVLGVTRRPSKHSLRVVYGGPEVHCKREDTGKALLLEAVREEETSVL